MTDRGKRRSLGQRIGSVVQVRATQGKSRPRIVLDRQDAISLLQQNQTTILVAVHVTDKSIHFQFIDEGFISQLHEFLASSRQRISISLTELGSDPSEFDRRLADLSRPGAQHRLRIHKAEREIERVIPGSLVSVVQGSRSGLATVDIPWVGSAFLVDPAEQETARVLFFEQGKLPDALPGLSLKPELLEVADLVDGLALLRGCIERDAEITAKYEGRKASALFQLRRLADEMAYTHPAGISLVHSDRRRRDDRWIHELHGRVFAGSLSLGEAKDVLPLLRLLRPGAKLFVDGDPFGSVEDWGDWLPKVGPAVEALEEIAKLVRLDLKRFRLSDFGVREFGTTIGFLETMLVHGVPLEKFTSGFILGPGAETPDELLTEPVLMELPVVANLVKDAIVLWVKVRGAAYLMEGGTWCGLRFDEQLAWSLDFHEKFNKSIYPEIWVSSNWPPILIGPEQPHTFGAKDLRQLELEAHISREAAPPHEA